MSEYQISEYNQTAAALTELRSRYVRPYDVSTTAGMAEAKEARATVRGYRVALEKTRVEIKAPALERTRRIDAEAKRITAELLAIKGRIAFVASRVIAASNRDSKTITAILKDLEAARLDEADYQEMLPEAVSAKITAIEKLEAMLDERLAYEAEQERIRAEREAVEKQRAEFEARHREEEAKQRKAETIASITSISAVKEALAAMEILPGEAIDRAYELGFNDGANAGLSVGNGLG